MFRGMVLAFFGLVCSVSFAVCMFSSENLLVFWLFMELSGLSIVPCFFVGDKADAMQGLFNFIVVSGISSVMIISGILYESLLFLSLLGLLIKFGVFPFSGWVYSVVSSSNWLVIWAISTVLKAAFLYVAFFISGGWDITIINGLCFCTFIVVAWLMWVYTPTWAVFWCHVLISSSAGFVAMGPEISCDLLSFLFGMYLVWSTAAICLLSRFESLQISSGGYYLMVVALVSFPGSIALIYKLVMGLCIYSCGGLVFWGWVIYNVSEQFFLIKYLISSGVPRRGQK